MNDNFVRAKELAVYDKFTRVNYPLGISKEIDVCTVKYTTQTHVVFTIGDGHVEFGIEKDEVVNRITHGNKT